MLGTARIMAVALASCLVAPCFAQAAKAVHPLLFPITYRCGDRDVQVGVFDDGVVMEIGGERIALTLVPAASGARYEADGDTETVFWSKGDKALVSLSGDQLEECVRVPSELAKPYTARGQEPGWFLRITNGRLELTTNMGAELIEGPLPAVRVADGHYVFDDESRHLRVAIAETLCHDIATGMPYPDTVTVETEGTTLQGCGGDPLDLLTGNPWVVEDIGGGGIIDRSHITLNFGANGRVFGSGGCNAFTGSYSLTGEGLSFGQAAVTMKACAEALMNQEGRFFKALAAVHRFDVDGSTDALLLVSAQGDTEIRATRSVRSGHAPAP